MKKTWTIDKSFNFAYGHRVHNQVLNADYTGSEGTCLACRHIHGHEGLIKVMLESTTLNNGFVTDFKNLGWFKDFLDNVLDHKFVMDINDPLIVHEVPEYLDGKDLDLDKCFLFPEGYWMPNLGILPGDTIQAVIEKYEGIVFVDFVPTSENLAAWLLEVAQKKMAKLDVKVVAVDFWETPKSHCRVDVA